MSAIEGFAPIVSANARVLILGTMPSVASLQKQQYYGHPNNAFWPIMCVLFDIEPGLAYEQRKVHLLEQRVAVWDVLQSCHREGSLDAKIQAETIKTNDFVRFFTEYKNIRRVFFNGKTAEKLYRQRVLPSLIAAFAYLDYQCLPSTSPAFASLNREQKLEAWKTIH